MLLVWWMDVGRLEGQEAPAVDEAELDKLRKDREAMLSREQVIAIEACVLRVCCMCVACVLHVCCVCVACVLHVCCVCVACVLRVCCMRCMYITEK